MDLFKRTLLISLGLHLALFSSLSYSNKIGEFIEREFSVINSTVKNVPEFYENFENSFYRIRE